MCWSWWQSCWGFLDISSNIPSDGFLPDLDLIVETKYLQQRLDVTERRHQISYNNARHDFQVCKSLEWQKIYLRCHHYNGWFCQGNYSWASWPLQITEKYSNIYQQNLLRILATITEPDFKSSHKLSFRVSLLIGPWDDNGGTDRPCLIKRSSWKLLKISTQL